MNTYFVQNLAGSLISEETFEIAIENVNRCVWCTVPDSRFLYNLPALRVDRKRLYMYKKRHLGAFRPRPLKINTSVNIQNVSLGTKLEKDPSKDLKMRKLNDTEKFIFFKIMNFACISVWFGDESSHCSVEDFKLEYFCFLLSCISKIIYP